MVYFQRSKYVRRLLAMLLCVGTFLCAADTSAIVGLNAAPEEYAEVLKTYVNDNGMVDYRDLKAHREKLDTFINNLAKVSPAEYDSWNYNQRVAFWINTYNALTLKAIIDHYPIKASFFKSRIYPKNSIRQIPGVWTELQFVVMGNEITLDEIEHSILRAKFKEPRIHMALVCAAMGCPSLRNKPYAGIRLDEQLDDQARRFLSNPKKFRVDRDNGIVYLSPIFKWFGDDFIMNYGTDKNFSGHEKAERAVLNYISKYVAEDEKQYLLNADYEISYLDYDWSLNEQSE